MKKTSYIYLADKEAIEMNILKQVLKIKRKLNLERLVNATVILASLGAYLYVAHYKK